MYKRQVLGIEDIGVQLEEQFNILPLRQYSEGIYSGVDDIKYNFEMRSRQEEAMRLAREEKKVQSETIVPSWKETRSASSSKPQTHSNLPSTEEEEDERDDGDIRQVIMT